MAGKERLLIVDGYNVLGAWPELSAGRSMADAREALVGEEVVRLTRTEFAILKLLMQNPGKALSKSVILERISPDTPDCTESSLKIHVSNLRKKLALAGASDAIEAVWGIGFRLKAQ